MIPQKKVLILGSGMMLPYLVEQILKRKENVITIGSNILSQANYFKNNYDRTSATQIDVTNKNDMKKIVSQHDIVISYVPYQFHANVMDICTEENKNFVSASYINPQMKTFHEAAMNKNLVFYNEVGLDPGIDHIVTALLLDKVKKEGGKTIEYESYCGALPSPDSIDNPFGYKFSWSPIGALKSLKNSCKYFENNEIHEKSSINNLLEAQPFKLNPALNLEGYYNRDSVSYKEIYNLTDAHKVVRGTLRYQGFTKFFAGYSILGLLDDKIPANVPQTKFDLLKIALNSENDNLKQLIEDKLAPYLTDENIKELIETLNWLGLFSKNEKIVSNGKTIIEYFCSILEPKLAYNKGERDLIAMQHIFKNVYEKSNEIEIIKSSLILIGESENKSAVAKTVGVPTAIVAQLILDGKIKRRGVLMPNDVEECQLILEELEKCHIKMRDEFTRIKMDSKLQNQ